MLYIKKNNWKTNKQTKKSYLIQHHINITNIIHEIFRELSVISGDQDHNAKAVIMGLVAIHMSTYNIQPTNLTHWGRMTHFASINQPSLVQIMACHLVGAKPLSEPMLELLLIGNSETNFSEIVSEIHTFSFKKMHLKISSTKWLAFRLGHKC